MRRRAGLSARPPGLGGAFTAALAVVVPLETSEAAAALEVRTEVPSVGAMEEALVEATGKLKR
jgi:hypothetical protein